MSADEAKYAGSELELFAKAGNWKSYWSSIVRPFVRGDVLEVGAGIGSNTRLLAPDGSGRWVCLEPDPDLCARLVPQLENAPPGRSYEAVCGTLRSLANREFDTILYIDVLEHIADDRDELRLAALRLRRGGRLIVLSPAHQFLFSPFDAAIGHFRRYSRAALLQLSPAGLLPVWSRYIDSAGLIASGANRLLLRQSMPTAAQIGVWDRWMVPVSRILDPLTRFNLGKSIVTIWRKA